MSAIYKHLIYVSYYDQLFENNLFGFFFVFFLVKSTIGALRCLLYVSSTLLLMCSDSKIIAVLTTEDVVYL